MKIQGIVVLLLITVTTLGLKCPKYYCNDKIDPEKGCAYYTISNEPTVTYTPCKDKKTPYCLYPSTFEEPGKCNETYYPYLFPGEYSENVEHCISKKIEKNICKGKSAGESCLSDVDCAPNLFCKEKICTLAKKVGEGCSDKEKCNANTICHQGNCTLLGSIAVGKNADFPAVCSTYYISEGMCAEGPKLKTTNISCPENGQCPYMQGGKDFNEPCLCGVTVDGKSFCMKGRGDFKVAEYFDYVKKDEIATKCHISRGPLCLSAKVMPPAFYKAYVSYMDFTEGNKFIDNPDCVKNMIHKFYHDAKAKSQNPETDQFGLYLFLGIAIGAILVIAVLLLVIYFKRRKSDEEEPLDSTSPSQAD